MLNAQRPRTETQNRDQHKYTKTTTANEKDIYMWYRIDWERPHVSEKEGKTYREKQKTSAIHYQQSDRHEEQYS